MLVVISPAKRLDWSPAPDLPLTDPAFGAEALALAEQARGLGVAELRRLMGISETLAQLNRDRFAAFSADPEPEMLRPAVFGFAGDTYAGLEAKTLDRDTLIWAQDHLRILSGLYGLLRPLDRIQPYRLEMGSRLATPRGASLYDWWGDRVATALNHDAAALGSDVLINCASIEYFTAANRPTLTLRVVTPVFLEERNGKQGIVSFWAKKARGAMARFIAENRLTDPRDIDAFEAGGYRLAPDLSEGDRRVFLRGG
ncbi:MAG: peroxide stress protein YaaA [Rhodobacteraceae bacterium]|nr:peroxide stress protein YaaA [Paracoccaceae bacterium]